MAGPGLTIGTSAGAIIFVGTIVALWVVAQFVSRRSDRANKTNPKLRRAEQKALSLSWSDPSSEAAIGAWQEVLRQARELDNEFVSGKALAVLGSIRFQRKEFNECLLSCDTAIKLLHTDKTRQLQASILLTKALAAEKLGHETLAQEALLEALRLNREIPNIGGELKVLNQLGAVYHRAGNRAEGEKYHQLTLELARECGDRSIEARALHNLGTLAHQDGRLDDGLTLLRQALEVKHELSDPSGFETMNNIGSIHYQKGEVELAEAIWTDALSQATKSGKRSASLLGNVAELKFARGESLEAIELRKEALNIRREAGDQPKVAQQLAWIGGKYLGIGDLEQGRDYCEQSMQIAESTQNEKLLASGLQNLATYYSKTGDVAQATGMTQRALALYKEAGDQRNVVVALNNLGSYAHLRGEFAKAETLLAEALHLADSLQDSKLQTTVISGIGLLKKDAGEPRSGLALLTQSAEMRKVRQDLRHECSSLANMASIEIDLGLMGLALDHANRAASIARMTGNKESEVISVLLVGGVYRERGELEKAKEITEQAMESAEKLGIVRNRLWARKNMGLISLYLGAFDYSVSILTDAAHQAHRYEFYLLEAMILADLSSAEIGRGDVEKGIARAEATLKLAENIASIMTIGNSWHWIGTGRQQLKQYDAAMTALRRALTVRESIEHCRGKAETHRKLAEVQRTLGDVADARESYRKSLDGFRSLGNESSARQVESDLKAFDL